MEEIIMHIKSTIKKLVPPILIELLKKPDKYGYFGDYKIWQDAVDGAVGYDSNVILEKVKNAVLKVKNGEAVYERDSVLFDKVQYCWPLLAGLLWIASLNKNKLSILDFGGSLGTSYFQNRNFLKHVDLKWTVCEQENFVKCGKEFFEDNVLKFIYKLTDIPKVEVSVFLASSSIQHLEDPYEFMKGVIKMEFPYIIIDRTPFLKDTERLTIHKVRPEICESSYASWFLNEKKFTELFKEKYNLIADFESLRTAPINLGDISAYERGFIFELKKN